MADSSYSSPQRLITIKRKSKEVCLTNEPLDAVEKVDHVEVEEKPDTDAAQLQVGQHLRLMNVCQSLHSLDLHEHLLLNAQIHPVSGIDFESIVFDRQHDFGFDVQPAFLNLMKQAEMVGPLEQPRPEFRVDLEATTKDSSGDLIDFQTSLLSLFDLCGRGRILRGWV